jgi:hypothetical protein
LLVPRLRLLLLLLLLSLFLGLDVSLGTGLTTPLLFLRLRLPTALAGLAINLLFNLHGRGIGRSLNSTSSIDDSLTLGTTTGDGAISRAGLVLTTRLDHVI